ncbi:TauD/TfdA dioxygenase family protein [Pseudomonas cannabina]|uniref:Taurine dioxygenase n=1 Tax=Pseudomonas cannabina TaxID=86840 RepID=A0A0P9LW86_PSECA|nr:TauD/TfdA family dioxygenase [Pseudomonas cannabina]KAA8711611.1 TauD/TfdA family dioxygenase [Pseudomonas cannabina]KPW75001.1 Taurine dioxygenase [Pseudomonas cannabina]RMN33513.1 Taurine dioxygenase [Pseudomonas cannabina]SDR30984.1 taurine dioxygenase [Pseudomonas cannabina]
MGVREFAPLRLQLGDALHMSDTELRHEVAQSKVVVIANKDVAVEPYVRLIRRLGTPVLHVLEKFCLSDYREVLAITNVYKDDQPLGVHDGGAYWHTDMSYKSANTVFTSMLSVHVPVLGGQTEFMDCVAGLQAVQQWMNSRECPEFIQALDLDALDVYHVFGNRDVLRNTDAKSQSLNDSEIQHVNGAVLHPLVTVHPLSGAHSLYATAGTSMRIKGLPDALAHRVLDTLLDFLVLHAPRYEHKYQPGDIVIWDNLSTMHRGPVIPKSVGGDDARLLYRMNVDFIEDSHHG